MYHCIVLNANSLRVKAIINGILRSTEGLLPTINTPTYTDFSVCIYVRKKAMVGSSKPINLERDMLRTITKQIAPRIFLNDSMPDCV